MTDSDPLQVNVRLYRQIAKLLDDMEAADRDDRMTMPQRIQGLIAVGRIQIMFGNLRKLAANDSSNAGSTVRKYAQAFAKPTKPHAVGGRKTLPRPTSVTELVGVDETGDDPDDDPTAA